MTGDRERWNQKWRERTGDLAPPAAFVAAQAAHLPTVGRGLDVAGGDGRHAVWLARRGLEVTLVDIADGGLERAGHRAASAGVAVRLVRADLEVDDLPGGAWDVIIVHHYLCRPLWPSLAAALVPGGVLLMCQPTIINLERHESPSRRFLVEPDELARFAADTGLEIVHARAGWNDAQRHEAELVARRPAVPA